MLFGSAAPATLKAPAFMPGLFYALFLSVGSKPGGFRRNEIIVAPEILFFIKRKNQVGIDHTTYADGKQKFETCKKNEHAGYDD